MSETSLPRTQRERSARTRQAIMDATIRCLVEEGYAGTSTSAIQARSGVSRGALTHQFPSKQELLIAAVHYLSEVREAEIHDSVQELPHGPGRRTEGLRSMARSFQGDLFAAAVELWNASRTDDALHRPLYAAEQQLGRRHRVLLTEIFGPDLAAHPAFHQAMDVLLRHLRGTALTDILRRRPSEEGQVAEEGVKLVSSILGVDLGDVAP